MTTDDNNATLLEVLVFKTNISSDKEMESVMRILNSEKKVFRWNIDRDDIDNVLRIESDSILPADIIRLLSEAGFQCEELAD